MWFKSVYCNKADIQLYIELNLLFLAIYYVWLYSVISLQESWNFEKRILSYLDIENHLALSTKSNHN